METSLNYEPTNSYKQSKLCNILFSNYLADYLKRNNNNVSVYSVSPGIVFTRLGRHIYEGMSTLKKLAYFLFYPVLWFLMRSSNEGAQTTIMCAVEPTFDNVSSSGFYRNCAKTELKPHATNEHDARRLWELSEKFVSEWLAE